MRRRSRISSGKYVLQDSLNIRDVIAKLTGFETCLTGAHFTIINLGSGTPVTRTGNNNASLSVPTLETSQLMKVDWLKSN
jgi:hypothetical protein